jgi:hypothetical protein
MRAALLSNKICARFPLIFILNHACTDHDSLLRFMLHNTAESDHLLPEIPRFLAIVAICRQQFGVM